MTERLRQELKAAKAAFQIIRDDYPPGVAFRESVLASIDQHIKSINEALAEQVVENPRVGVYAQTDEVLSESPIDIEAIKKEAFDKGVAYYRPTSEQVQRWLEEARKDGEKRQAESVESTLLDLPERIKRQAVLVATDSFAVEGKRAEISRIEYEVDSIIATDDKLTNESKRRAAKKLALQQHDKYSKLCDELTALEKQVKFGQVEFYYLQDLLKANIAIAQMQGAK